MKDKFSFLSVRNSQRGGGGGGGVGANFIHAYIATHNNDFGRFSRHLFGFWSFCSAFARFSLCSTAARQGSRVLDNRAIARQVEALIVYGLWLTLARKRCVINRP